MPRLAHGRRTDEPSRLRRICLPAVAAALSLAFPAAAHVFETTDVTVTLEAGAAYRIELIADIDALALGVSPATDSAEVADALRSMEPAELEKALDRVRRTLTRRLRIRFDGEKQVPRIEFPDHGTPAATLADIPTLLGTTARLSGELPPGAETFTFGASRAFKQVRLTIEDASTGERTSHVLEPSEDSPPFAIGAPVPPPGRLAVATRYARLGFTHILPKGLDHILFVLGLFLLSPKARPLLWQVSGFTLAHTITLALSIHGVITLPPRVVEPLIAVSIAYVAVENLFTSELKPWRPLAVFGFGLLHGLGFAGVLRELGMPGGQLVTALLAFNVGVELGQLAVIVVAFLAVGLFRNHPDYRKRIVIPASSIIALIGCYWAVERLL